MTDTTPAPQSTLVQVGAPPTATITTVPVNDDRRTLAEVTPAALAGWQAFAQKHGTTVTALAEVIGLFLAAQAHRTPAPWLERVIVQAKALDAERRRRR